MTLPLHPSLTPGLNYNGGYPVVGMTIRLVAQRALHDQPSSVVQLHEHRIV